MNHILCTLCSMINGQHDRAVPQLSQHDWQRLIEYAQAEGVIPLVYQALNTRGQRDVMPPEFRTKLQLAYYQSLAQNTLIQQELLRVLDAAPAPVVVLKGLALGSSVYADATLRPVSDIDLFVRETDLPAMIESLHTLGYVETPELTTGLNRIVEYHTRFQGGPRHSVIVELHWRLVAGSADWRSPAVDWFWQQTEAWQPRHTGSYTVAQSLQFTPTAHLLYLAAHLILQHGGTQARLIWFYDLHLLLTRAGIHIDWEQVRVRAKQLNWDVAIVAALRGAQQYFGTPVPEQMLNALSADSDPAVQQFVRHKATAAPTPVAQEWIKLHALGWRARLKFIFSLLMPRPNYILWRYRCCPAWLWPLWYIYHWGRLLQAGFVLVGQRVRPRNPA